MEKHTLLLVDDHALFREGLTSLLSTQPDFQVVGEAGNGRAAVEQACQLRPELVLMDINMPSMDGLAATLAIKQELPEIKVVMLTMLGDDDNLFAAIKGGAEGYILKSTTGKEMIAQVRSALRGELALTPSLAQRIVREFGRAGGVAASPEEPALTAREREVLTLVAQGAPNKEVAQALTISEFTAKAHMRSILDKLHVRSRAEAAAYALRRGWVSPSTSELSARE